MKQRDLELSCATCGDAFVFSAVERERFERKGLRRPRRCPACRAARRASPTSTAPADPRPPDPNEVVCSACGALTRLKFVPEGDRPVYCDACFRNR